jgi:hypothetical protein
MEISKIREMAKFFADIPIYDTRVGGVASHPFTNTWITGIYDKDRKLTFVDLRKEDEQAKWREQIKATIEESDLRGICLMLNKPYILTFISYIESMLSDEELGMILGTFWTAIENITGDSNVNGMEIVKWFKRADKKSLMNEEELLVYESLPEEVTVYRGVTSYNRKKEKALSWTLDYEKAVWFANRFSTGTGEVWTMTAPKKRILCYFDGCNEQEAIVDLYRFKGKKEVQKV